MMAEQTEGRIVPAGHRVDDLQFWQRGWFWLLLALVSVLPFLATPIPPLTDYFTHIARFHVMGEGASSPFLPHYYQFQWRLMGNLGVDLLMVPVGRILGAEEGGFLVAAMLPPALIGALYWLSRTAHGRVQAPALLALPLGYAMPFVYGFMNYWLSVIVGLYVVVLWLRMEERSALLRAAVFLPLSALVWLCHLAGWGVLIAILGCCEFVRAIRIHGMKPAILWEPVVRMLPLLVPGIATIVWQAMAPPSGPSVPWTFLFRVKLFYVEILLKGENELLDVASLVVMAVPGAILFFYPRARRHAGLLLAGFALLTLFLILPQMLLSSFYADARLLPPAAILLLVGLGLGPERRRLAMAVALVALALFGTRMAVTTIGWHQRGTALAAALKGLEQVPRGARIAVLSTVSIGDGWPLHGYDHVASLAVPRREAFVNTYWLQPGAQLMQPIYQKDRPFNSPNELQFSPGDDPALPTMEARLAELPRDRFDYLWVFRRPLPPRLRAGLQLIHETPQSQLYRIERGPEGKP